jgi:hypothetical protein
VRGGRLRLLVDQGFLGQVAKRESAVVDLIDFTLQFAPVVQPGLASFQTLLVRDEVQHTRESPVALPVRTPVREHLHHAQINPQLHKLNAVATDNQASANLARTVVPIGGEFLQVQ